jgi:hypothetical protein
MVQNNYDIPLCDAEENNEKRSRESRNLLNLKICDA